MMKKAGIRRKLIAVAVFGLATVVGSAAQTLKTIFIPDGSEGGNPAGSLIQGFDGDLNGTNENFGVGSSGGTLVRMTTGGGLFFSTNFCAQTDCPYGIHPVGALAQAANGTFYAMTQDGGTNNSGTVVSINSGTFTTLYNFCSQTNCADGGVPFGGLVQGPDGNFYGTTSGGGSGGAGTVFRITPTGAFTMLYAFSSPTGPDGANPYAALVLGSDGNLYGTTQNGGTQGSGVVFKITRTGKLTTLYSFCSLTNCADGSNPWAALTQASDGNFYGTTQWGGNPGFGTIFKITPSGKLTTLYNFCSLSGCTDGANPIAGVIQATDGSLYGTTTFTEASCTQDCGTIFKLTPTGLTTLYTFCTQVNCPDGADPRGGLVQAADGKFYGGTFGGGSYSGECATQGCGVFWQLSTGLGPFVKTNPNFGKVGSTINILGYNLNGATSASFNGTPATFTVVSNTHIQATVPIGAASGKIQVVTPKGTLLSNLAFRVLP